MSERSTATPTVHPLPAATVMLVRDHDAGHGPGVEVFLMERSAHGQFGGLHVFPGGKVDPSDRTPDWADICHGIDDDHASRMLGLPSDGLGYWIACIRECFEEAGVLLATGRDGETLRFRSERMRTRYETWRERINGGEADAFAEMCRSEGLHLETDQIAYVSHWITPHGQPRRFDTRFFVARAPATQAALHDGFETIESHWIRPEQALARFQSGELNLISPTEKNLEAIAGFDTTEELLAHKRAVDPSTIPTILPRVTPRPDGGFDEVLEVVEEPADHGRTGPGPGDAS